MIYLGSDHAGLPAKELIKNYLQDANLEFTDLGTHSLDSVDYPDFAHDVANAVLNNQAAVGILVCGSGIGVSIAANRHAGVRAALCWLPEIAKLSRQHNDANVLCIPGRFVTTSLELNDIVSAFLETDFEGGRHKNRIQKIEILK